jgi:hypothetical protein
MPSRKVWPGDRTVSPPRQPVVSNRRVGLSGRLAPDEQRMAPRVPRSVHRRSGSVSARSRDANETSSDLHPATREPHLGARGCTPRHENRTRRTADAAPCASRSIRRAREKEHRRPLPCTRELRGVPRGHARAPLVQTVGRDEPAIAPAVPGQTTRAASGLHHATHRAHPGAPRSGCSLNATVGVPCAEGNHSARR